MTQWAPVLFQPIPGSEERVVIAIAAVDGTETRCMQTIDPSILNAVFRDDRRYVTDVIRLATQSLREHLTHNPSLAAWPPPMETVFLGSEQQTTSSDIDELVRRAGAMSTVFHADYFQAQSKVPKERQWTEEVLAILLERNERLSDHLQVRVPLGGHDAPAQFTFLNPSLAANLVTFSRSNLKRRLEQARADLWSLSLLADAPYIFRPQRRELLAGADSPKEGEDANVREAIDEIADEASRRDVLVTEFQTPGQVAEHILAYA